MTPVLIRGVHYRSIALAARALNVHERTIYKHLDAGTPDLIGSLRATEPRRCMLDGVEYPSLRAAALAAGISREAVRQRVNREEKAKGKSA